MARRHALHRLAAAAEPRPRKEDSADAAARRAAQTGEHVRTNPTIVSNFEEVQYKNTRLSLWDLGGQAAHRGLWRYHFAGSKGLLFAIDSSDRQRVHEARRELFDLLDDEKLSEAVLMVLANKQDVPDAMTAEEVAEALGLWKRLGTGRRWYVQPCSALYGEGITEAMDWIIQNMRRAGHAPAAPDAVGSGRHFPTAGVKCADQWRARLPETPQPARARERSERSGERITLDAGAEEPSTRSLLGTESMVLDSDEEGAAAFADPSSPPPDRPRSGGSAGRGAFPAVAAPEAGGAGGGRRRRGGVEARELRAAGRRRCWGGR